VHIYNIEILDYSWPILKIRTGVSSGTYIRTLGEDIGVKLGTGAYLTALRRTKIADYSVEDATTLEEFMKN
jgi:tRNA pseudouridine55 synthase